MQDINPDNSPEFGNFADNATALTIALRTIQQGNIQEGIDFLRRLRQHILRTQEVKSFTWLLPLIQQAIDF